MEEILSEHDWEEWCNSSVYHLYPTLRKGLFHRTNVDGFRGISRDGFIFPNNGQYPIKYPQTKHYYGFSQRWISLFDFASGTDEQRISIHNTWAQFFSDYEPFTIVFELNRSLLRGKIIANSVAPRLGDPGYKGFIPYIEVWYPEPVPISAITSYILTCYSPEDHRIHFEMYPSAQVDAIERLIDEFITSRSQ